MWSHCSFVEVQKCCIVICVLLLRCVLSCGVSAYILVSQDIYWTKQSPSSVYCETRPCTHLVMLLLHDVSSCVAEHDSCRRMCQHFCGAGYLRLTWGSRRVCSHLINHLDDIRFRWVVYRLQLSLQTVCKGVSFLGVWESKCTWCNRGQVTVEILITRLVMFHSLSSMELHWLLRWLKDSLIAGKNRLRVGVTSLSTAAHIPRQPPGGVPGADHTKWDESQRVGRHHALHLNNTRPSSSLLPTLPYSWLLGCGQAWIGLHVVGEYSPTCRRTMIIHPPSRAQEG